MALVELLGFAAFFGAASVVFADEFALQRALLGGARRTARAGGPTAPRRSLEVVLALLETPRSLIDGGGGGRRPRARAIRWSGPCAGWPA